MIKKYRKIAEEVEALQLTRELCLTGQDEIKEFIDENEATIEIKGDSIHMSNIRLQDWHDGVVKVDCWLIKDRLGMVDIKSNRKFKEMYEEVK
jgi:hypothetical protein